MKDVPSALETPAAPHTSPAVGYRDLAVHLDGSPEDEYRVAHAESLAVSFGGHLVGLYTNPLPSPASFASNFGVTTLGKLTEAAMAAGDAAESSLRHRLARLGTDQELRRIQGRAGFSSSLLSGRHAALTCSWQLPRATTTTCVGRP